MASCGLKNWQDKVSDSLTEWKEEYAHRGFCDMLDGDCDLHDTPEVILKHQIALKTKIEHYERETDVLKYMLNKHQEKWGTKT